MKNNRNHSRKRKNSGKQGLFNKKQRENQDYQRKDSHKNNSAGPVSGAHAANQNRPHLPEGQEEQQAGYQAKRPEPAVPVVLKRCTLCNKIINEMSTAIKHNNQDEYIHFDCAVKDIREKEKPYPNERICYLGKGSFGIIKFLSYSSSPIKFLIKKRIQYEVIE